MRYYTITIPGRPDIVTTRVRDRRNLPEGTEVWCHITDRDGSLCECYQVPVVAGKVQIAGNGKHRPHIWQG